MTPRRIRRNTSRAAARSRGGRHVYRRRRLGFAAVLAAVLLILFLAGVFTGGATPASSSGPEVRAIPVNGIIDPLMADYVSRSIDAAQRDQVKAVVLELDTPGGLDGPMRDIIKKMESSPLPVIAYVSPSGARAASAGTFICMAADVTAMAPGTNLGAAHPVGIGADPGTEEGRKVINDSAAYIRSLADANGHNADWAELAVLQSVSLPADDALSEKVIDFKASDLSALLGQVNGFKTKAKGITLETRGATVTTAGMDVKERLLYFLDNPNVAYLLLVFGLLALAFEFVHPGIGVGAAAGIIALLLAGYSLYQLPVNLVGILLTIFGVGLLAAELFVPAHGTLTAAGVISMIAGSFLLYDSSAGFLRVSLPLNIVMAALALGFFIFVARAGIRARRLPVKNPRSAMIGKSGVTRTRLDPLGQVFIMGEIWSAEAPGDEPIEKGEEVEVVEVSGLILKVRRTV